MESIALYQLPRWGGDWRLLPVYCATKVEPTVSAVMDWLHTGNFQCVGGSCKFALNVALCIIRGSIGTRSKNTSTTC